MTKKRSSPTRVVSRRTMSDPASMRRSSTTTTRTTRRSRSPAAGRSSVTPMHRRSAVKSSGSSRRRIASTSCWVARTSIPKSTALPALTRRSVVHRRRTTSRTSSSRTRRRLSFNYLLRYNFDILGGNLAAQLDGAWYDDQFLEITNGTGTVQPSYNISNVRVTYTSGSERFAITGWVTNLHRRGVQDVLARPG